MRSTLLSFVFLLLFGSAWLFGAEPAQEGVQVRPVAGNVSWLEGRGGNVGISAGPDGTLIVDDQYANMAPAIEEAALSLSESGPAFLINTHHHGDHTGGNAHVGGKLTLVAHDNVRARLAGQPADALPVITYADGLSIHFNGEEVRIFHVPSGHTDGDSVVWFTGSNVVHMGDLYFQSSYPFIDLAGGGNALGLMEGIRAVIERVPADARVIPGHGVPTGVDGLREYLSMLETIGDRVIEGKLEGKTPAELVEARVTSDYDERWHTGSFVTPLKLVDAIWNSLD